MAGAPTPVTAGNCLMMMVIARPKAKPRSTGREMKPARFPSRSSDAVTNRTPVSATITVTSAILSVVDPGSVAIVAARMAAEDDVGDTMAKRLLPKME
ncbi:hypothetical protein D9M72_576510 [compost metagenome]